MHSDCFPVIRRQFGDYELSQLSFATTAKCHSLLLALRCELAEGSAETLCNMVDALLFLYWDFTIIRSGYRDDCVSLLVSSRHPTAIEADSQVDDVVFVDVSRVRLANHCYCFIKDSCYCYLHMTVITCAVHHIHVKMATQFHQTTMTDTHIHSGGDKRTCHDKWYITRCITYMST